MWDIPLHGIVMEMSVIKKIQIYVAAFSMIIGLSILMTPLIAKAEVRKYLFSCSSGQVIVVSASKGLLKQGEATPDPALKCWTDSNSNNVQDQTDQYGNVTQVTGKADLNTWAADVTCSGEPQLGFGVFSCSDGGVPSVIVRAATRGELPTSDSPAPSSLDTHCEEDPLTADNCPIVDYLVKFINGLSALVGIVVVIMIAVGGIQYSSSRDNPQQVSAAKNRIRNAIIALLLYLFMYAFLQWLIPGGVL